MWSSKKNWLLKWGIACYSLFVFCFFFWPYKLGEVFTSRADLGTNRFFLIFLLAVFLAPLLEEIAFRGYFTNKKWLKILSLVFLLLALAEAVFLNENLNMITVFIAIGYFLLLFLQKRKGSIFTENLLLGYSALFFALLHWEVSDFQYALYVLPVVVSHFGGGLVLLWITINFSLLKSILFHAGYNFLMMLILFCAIQFPNEKLHQMESENLKIEWKQVPFIAQENGQQVSVGKDSVSATHAKLSTVLGLMMWDKEKKIEYIEKTPLMHYDFKIYTKDRSESKGLFKFYNELEKLLEKADLIYDNSLAPNS